MGVLDYAQENWNRLDSQERKKVLSTLFPDMNEEAQQEISLLQFGDLPSKHDSTWKDIPDTLLMAATPEEFSDLEEIKVRNTFAR